MKQNKTMYRIARATAIRMGPRTYTLPRGTKLAGYYLTHEELLQIHKREGFNTHSKDAPWLRRIEDWKDTEDVTDVAGTYFFTKISTTPRVVLERYVEKEGIKEFYV